MVGPSCPSRHVIFVPIGPAGRPERTGDQPLCERRRRPSAFVLTQIDGRTAAPARRSVLAQRLPAAEVAHRLQLHPQRLHRLATPLDSGLCCYLCRTALTFASRADRTSRHHLTCAQCGCTRAVDSGCATGHLDDAAPPEPSTVIMVSPAGPASNHPIPEVCSAGRNRPIRPVATCRSQLSRSR